jgi:hypothetical protein
VVAALCRSERGWRVSVPWQQCVQLVVLGSPGDDPLQGVGEIGRLWPGGPSGKAFACHSGAVGTQSRRLERWRRRE